MDRQEKQLVIESLKNDFSQSQAAFLVGVQGLTVGQMQSLRKGLREQGGVMRVAKNTLLNRAVDGIAGAEELRPYFSQQIAVVFAKDEAPAVARVIDDATRDNEGFSVVAGYFDGGLLGVDKIKFLASLPPKEQLLAQLCAGLCAPISSCIGVMNQVVAQFLCVLQQASEKK